MFFIHELIPLTDWEVVSVITHSEHIRIRSEGEVINVINTYNPPSMADQHQIEVWPQLAQMLSQTTRKNLLLGDFNALEFATADLGGRLILFLPKDEWAPTRDHILIKIRMDLPPPPQRSSKRFALEKEEWDSIHMMIREGQWWKPESPHRLQALTEAVKQALTDFCPKQVPKDKPRHDWSPLANELLHASRKAHQKYQRSKTEEDGKSWNQIRRQLQKEIRSNNRAR